MLSAMSDLRPFRIDVPDSVLADLRERLARTRWTDQIPDTGWKLGTDTAYLRELCDYWREGYDWRAQEAQLNAVPQFTTEIDGQRIHFVHARSKHEDALPLVITHGWPGSVLEFQKITPLLTDPEAHGGRKEDAFHVVCPSMPGYGFSGPTADRGWDPKRIAAAEVELMRRLGYERYGAQGGDWGSMVTSQIGALDPEHCAGIHLNMVIALPQEGELDEQEQGWATDTQTFNTRETGYQQIQGTKPQTLGLSLNDSPAGLCGWIVEKFRTWSDCGGDVESVFSRDELLTNVMIYWVTETINSSIRLYYEVMQGGTALPTEKVPVPMGCAIFPREIYKAPRKWAEALYDVRHYEVYEKGGHFAAMEQPQALAKDLRTFFAMVR